MDHRLVPTLKSCSLLHSGSEFVIIVVIGRQCVNSSYLTPFATPRTSYEAWGMRQTRDKSASDPLRL